MTHGRMRHQLFNLGEENRWDLPNGLFKSQQTVYNKFRRNTTFLQNVKGEDPTAWSETMFERLRTACTWFEQNTGFQPPEGIVEIRQAVAERITMSDAAPSQKRSGSPTEQAEAEEVKSQINFCKTIFWNEELVQYNPKAVLYL